MSKISYLPGAMEDPKMILSRILSEEGLEGVAIVAFVRTEDGKAVTRVALSPLTEMQISYAATTLLKFAVDRDSWEDSDERD